MAMSKQLSTKSVTFVKGGPTGLVGKQTKTGTQVPGQTAVGVTGAGDVGATMQIQKHRLSGGTRWPQPFPGTAANLCGLHLHTCRRRKHARRGLVARRTHLIKAAAAQSEFAQLALHGIVKKA